jgi:hypothetical protein
MHWLVFIAKSLLQVLGPLFVNMYENYIFLSSSPCSSKVRFWHSASQNQMNYETKTDFFVVVFVFVLVGSFFLFGLKINSPTQKATKEVWQ